LFVHLHHNSKTTRLNFTEFVACVRGSVLVWRRCDTLCTSGFTDDVIFLFRGTGKQNQARVEEVRQVAVPVVLVELVRMRHRVSKFAIYRVGQRYGQEYSVRFFWPTLYVAVSQFTRAERRTRSAVTRSYRRCRRTVTLRTASVTRPTPSQPNVSTRRTEYFYTLAFYMKVRFLLSL